ncbi:flagellin [Salinarimonas sp.]|uniref:flagellin N-terminal helical domain-containing protein n=1 Tax=Salinarimonas sp. TaxID=2766526 RepID=UPI00391D5C46
MSSLLTNSAAMTALQTLTATNKKMEVTQNRIATGMRVSSAADNAAYWSIATTMRSDNKALGAVQDALGLGAATVDVMYTALNSTVDVVSEIKAKLTAARQPGVDRGKIQDEIGELQNQLRNIGASAVFNGQNWLSFDSSAAGFNNTREIVSSFTRAADNSVTLQTITVNLGDIALFDANGNAGILDTETTGPGGAFSVANLNIGALTDSAADLDQLDAMIGHVDTQLGAITDAATNLGAIKNRIGLQQDFVKALKDAIDRGVGQLVDADMNAESTRLQALQVQQQLGIQALSIANSNSQNILSLFR